uniref:(northern house mosquito) hypothetical protein n=1 Tax=Culex pipiens TaxID=7175 RepID=A0A8D8B9C2_CULPI
MNNRWNIPKTLTLTKEPKKNTHTQCQKTIVSQKHMKQTHTNKQEYLEHTHVAIGSRTLPHSVSLSLLIQTLTRTQSAYLLRLCKCVLRQKIRAFIALLTVVV